MPIERGQIIIIIFNYSIKLQVQPSHADYSAVTF